MTDSPSRPSAPKAPPRIRALRLRFLSGGQAESTLNELWLILRHPYLMIYYAGSMTLSFLLSLLLDERIAGGPSVALLVPILVLANLVGVASFAGWVHLIAFLRPRADPVSLLVSFPLALSIIAVQATTTILWNIILDVPSPSLASIAVTLLAVYLFDEVVIWRFISPRSEQIVNDVRAFDGLLPRRRPDIAAATPAGRQIVLSARPIPVESILQIRAQGNYVEVWTDTDALTAPGPFSVLLAQMPAGLGCLVHRSEWVATRAVICAQRQGRATELRLSNGNTVRVASTRAGKVRDWLASFDPEPARRRSQSADLGGGDTNRQSRPPPEITTVAIGANAPSAPKAPVIPSKI